MVCVYGQALQQYHRRVCRCTIAPRTQIITCTHMAPNAVDSVILWRVLALFCWKLSFPFINVAVLSFKDLIWHVFFMPLSSFPDGASVADSIDTVFQYSSPPICNVMDKHLTILNKSSLGSIGLVYNSVGSHSATEFVGSGWSMYTCLLEVNGISVLLTVRSCLSSFHCCNEMFFLSLSCHIVLTSCRILPVSACKYVCSVAAVNRASRFSKVVGPGTEKLTQNGFNFVNSCTWALCTFVNSCT